MNPNKDTRPDAKDHRITVRFTSDEGTAFRDKVEAQGASAAGVLRGLANKWAAMGADDEADDVPAALRDAQTRAALHRVGIELEDIARSLRAYGGHVSRTDRARIASAKAALAVIEGQLLGEAKK